MNPNHLPRIAGHALLRRLELADLAVFHAYRSDAELARFQGWSPMSGSEAESFLRQMSDVQLFLPGVWAQIAIARQSDAGLVGDIGMRLSEDGREAEIGFTLGRANHGKGYASAAVAGAVDMLFEHTQVATVTAITDARNTASIAVLERVGMRQVESRSVEFKGEPCTELIYVRAR